MKIGKSSAIFMILMFAAIASWFIPTAMVFSEKSVTINDFNVTWHDCQHGLTQHSCYVDIQNLDMITSRYFNLSSIISDTNYDIYAHAADMNVYEYTTVDMAFPTYNTALINKTCYDETWSDNVTLISNESYDCSYMTDMINGSVTKSVAQWERSKGNMLKEGSRQKMYVGMINIPKYDTEKVEIDDLGTVYEYNGTKLFKVEWTTPITETGSEFGSTGKIAFWDDYNEYCPRWNATWNYRQPIEINTTINISNYQFFINVTYDSDMQPDFSDIRFTDDDDNEIPYWVELQSDGNYADVWIKITVNTINGTQAIMYYDNNTAVMSQSSKTDVLGDNLVSWYQMNGDAIDTFNIENGTVTGATLTTDKDGNLNSAYYFDGSGDWITISDSTNPFFTGLTAERSISLWYQPYSSANMVLFRDRTNTGIWYTINYATLQDLETKFYEGTYKDAESNQQTVNASWYHIVATYGDGFGKIYVNGVENGSVVVTGTLQAPSPSVFRIGADEGGGGPVNGIIDEFRIYNKSLSATEIASMYIPIEPTYLFGAEESADVNTAPTVTANISSPEIVYQDTDWLINMTATDPDAGDTLTGYANLFVNDTFIGFYSNPMVNNTNTLVATLGSGNFTDDDNLTAETWVGDGTINTTAVNLTAAVSDIEFSIDLNSPDNETSTYDTTPDFNFTVKGNQDTYGCELFIDDVGYGVYEKKCYQETANVSTECGGLTTGVYGDCSGVGCSYLSNPYNYVYDSNWDTYASSTLDGNYFIFPINYTKPVFSLNNSLWEVKGENKANLSILQSCWDYDSTKIILKIISQTFPNYVKAYCYDGSWNQIGSLYGNRLYEEAIWWEFNITLNDTATILTANDTLTDGTYDWYVNCTYGSIVNQSSIRNIRIDTVYPQVDLVSPTDVDYANVTRDYTYINWTVTESYPGTMILNWNGTNSTVTDTFINKTGLTEGTYTYYVWTNDTAGNGNQSETRTFTIDVTAPIISAYYQWNSTNDTVDFGIWTDGFVSVNWNLTDVTGINTSTCLIRVRNKNYMTNYTNLSYIDDLNHPDYDITTGYKNLTCYTEDLGGGVTRVTANMTRSHDWRPLNTAFDQDSAAHDNIYYSHGSRSTKIVFHNITNTINTTFIFLADIDNQTGTLSEQLFIACNLSYISGDFMISPYCALVGVADVNAARDVNFGYVIGALETDENGMFGGVVLTETLYGISYCPGCTNNNNAWITYSTNGPDGHSETSPNQGLNWNTLSGEEFNVILHVIDNTRLEFNLTIDDVLGTTLNNLTADDYGPPGNKPPFGDITTDNITGGLVSYHDIHGITESGTICINVTAADPNADTMNVSIYLLNNDSSYNQTLLSNYSVDGYGLICHQWDTTNVSDGDYRLNVTAFDGELTGFDESAGYVRINNHIITVTLNAPVNATCTADNTPSFNFTASGMNDTYVCKLYIDSILHDINQTVCNATSTILTATSALSDDIYDWNITCNYSTYTAASETRQLTVDSISESISTDFNSYTTPNTAWGFPDGIVDIGNEPNTDDANTSLMLVISINYTQLSPDMSTTAYSLNMTEHYITDINNYDVTSVLNSTGDNISYTFIDGMLDFMTEPISGSKIYRLNINITDGAQIFIDSQASAYDTPWLISSIQLDDSLTLNVSGSFWVHWDLAAASQFNANTQALYAYYACGDATFFGGWFLWPGHTPGGYMITKETELNNAYDSFDVCMGHPYTVDINMRACDSASDGHMDRITYNASFPNHNTTLAKQEFGLTIIADTDIDRAYIQSSSSTYEPDDAPRSGSNLDAPEDIIEEIKKKFIEERLLKCPIGYFFNHTSNHCEPYISPLAILEQDIINSTRKLFIILAQPLTIDIPTYVQDRTTLGPQLIIPSLLFISIIVSMTYLYIDRSMRRRLSSGLKDLIRRSRTVRPISKRPVSRVVGRQKVLRPSR